MGGGSVKPVGTTSHSSGASAEECADCARARGCAECFDELVRRFQSPLLHFLIRRLGSRQDAEDVLQETFLAAYRNLDRYRSTWRFSTWVFTIASRLAASNLRRRKKITGPMGASVDGISPMKSAEDNELRGSLWDAARQCLEPDAFTALWLNYVEAMPADEIGRVLGRSANAVRILLHRARGRLAMELKSV
jgi:RNA polymerase sigma-70 factor (ECF subfamily)